MVDNLGEAYDGTIGDGHGAAVTFSGMALSSCLAGPPRNRADG